MKVHNEPKFDTDHDGREIVRLPVGRDRHEAVLDKADYDYLQKLAGRTSFTLSANGYVICTINGGRDYVARILTMARPTQRVTYADGDKLNLRRSNLSVKAVAPSIYARSYISKEVA